MADHLTPDDLAAFLRSRVSVNAQIAADWVTDHPDHPATAAAVDQLEELARAAGLELRSEVHNDDLDGHLGIWWHEWIMAVPDSWAPYSVLPILAVLTGWPPINRFQPAACPRDAWRNVTAGARRFLRRFLPAWTAALVRRLRRAAAVSA